MIGLVRAATLCATLALGLVTAQAADKAFKRDDLADSAVKLAAQIKSEAGPEIAAPEGGVGIGSQRRPRFGDRASLALDLGLELEGGIRQIVAPEGLVRRLRREQAERQRGAKHRGANQTGHDGAPCADRRRVRIELRKKVTDSWRENKGAKRHV